jgi:hypothetical protein
MWGFKTHISFIYMDLLVKCAFCLVHYYIIYLCYQLSIYSDACISSVISQVDPQDIVMVCA